jgi:hypothetical protein
MEVPRCNLACTRACHLSMLRKLHRSTSQDHQCTASGSTNAHALTHMHALPRACTKLGPERIGGAGDGAPLDDRQGPGPDQEPARPPGAPAAAGGHPWGAGGCHQPLSCRQLHARPREGGRAGGRGVPVQVSWGGATRAAVGLLLCCRCWCADAAVGLLLLPLLARSCCCWAACVGGLCVPAVDMCSLVVHYPELWAPTATAHLVAGRGSQQRACGSSRGGRWSCRWCQEGVRMGARCASSAWCGKQPSPSSPCGICVRVGHVSCGLLLLEVGIANVRSVCTAWHRYHVRCDQMNRAPGYDAAAVGCLVGGGNK